MTARVALARVTGSDVLGPSVIRLVLAGVVLMLRQGLLVRELSAAFIPCELTILAVTAAYWTGISVGYAISNTVSDRWAGRLAIVGLGLQAALCVVRLWPMAGLSLGSSARSWAVWWPLGTNDGGWARRF